MSREISTTIDIDAPARRVWQVLMDFAAYPDWNPFIRKISGEHRAGTRLSVEIQLPGSKPMGFRPRVLQSDEDLAFRWLGHFLVPGLMDGEHRFILEVLAANKTRLRHEEIFRGIIAAPVLRLIEDATRRGFESMNQALKQRVEAWH